MKLRVGVVGTGEMWEKRYRPALRTLADRFELTAVCEPVALRAIQVAREFDAIAVDGFRVLAQRDDVDAILVLSRHWFNGLPILAACDAGKAVYCCDGLDIDPATAQRLKERIEAAGVAFMAEFPRRHAPATLRLKELIATRLGQPRLLFAHLRKPVTPPGRNGKCSAGVGQELAELVDWCRYVVDREPTSIFASSHGTELGQFDGDYHAFSMEFAADTPQSSALAQNSCGNYMAASWPEAISFRPPAALQVACENGIAFVDLPSTVVWFDSAGRHMESLDSERPVGETLLLSFHRQVTSLVRNPSSLQDAYRAISIVSAARTSLLEGRRVPLSF